MFPWFKGCSEWRRSGFCPGRWWIRTGLFRAEERVFTVTLDGWRAQMLGRGLTTDTIKQRCQLLERFQEFTGELPWQWRPADVDDFLAGLLSGEEPTRLKTLRFYSNAVAMFCAHLTILATAGVSSANHFRRYTKPDLL